jgi:hypothetical protein
MLYVRKVDICNILDTTHIQLSDALPETLKNELNWHIRRAKFTDKQAFDVVKHFRGLWNDEKITRIVHNCTNKRVLKQLIDS